MYEVYRFGKCEVDSGRRQVRIDGRLAEFQPKTFDLLLYLIENRGRVIAKDELFEKIWLDTDVSESSLTQAIRRVRALIGDDGGRQTAIQTRQGHGYQFVGEIKVLAGSHEESAQIASTSTHKSVWLIRVLVLVLLATVAAALYFLWLAPAAPGQGKTSPGADESLGVHTQPCRPPPEFARLRRV